MLRHYITEPIDYEEAAKRAYSSSIPMRGKMPESFQKLYQQIYSEFFPSSEYQPCGGTDFEAYPSADVYSPDYHCEVWVAVEKK